MIIKDLLKFAQPFAVGYLDGKTCGMSENRINMISDIDKYAYSLGYDQGVAEYSDSLESEEWYTQRNYEKR
jgi:hypothetical protein